MRIVRKAAQFALMAAIGLLAFQACSSSLMESEADESAAAALEIQSFQDQTPAILGDIDIKAAYSHPVAQKPAGSDFFAKVTTPRKLLNFAESNDNELSFTGRRWTIVAKVISAEEGGVIEFGSDDIGYSTIEFPPGALEADQLITVVHKLKGKRDIFFFPEGLQFNEPVTVQFPLAGLNERQIDRLLRMRLWYHNDQLEAWELVSSSSDGAWVAATLEHFSRYAIGSDE